MALLLWSKFVIREGSAASYRTVPVGANRKHASRYDRRARFLPVSHVSKRAAQAARANMQSRNMALALLLGLAAVDGLGEHFNRTTTWRMPPGVISHRGGGSRSLQASSKGSGIYRRKGYGSRRLMHNKTASSEGDGVPSPSKPAKTSVDVGELASRKFPHGRMVIDAISVSALAMGLFVAIRGVVSRKAPAEVLPAERAALRPE